MFNLTKYSDNYSDTSGRLWQFKRDKSSVTNTRNPDNVATDNLTSFKYKSSFLGESNAVNKNRICTNVKLAVPRKYLSNFWRSLGKPLTNFKIHLE